MLFQSLGKVVERLSFFRKVGPVYSWALWQLSEREAHMHTHTQTHNNETIIKQTTRIIKGTRYSYTCRNTHTTKPMKPTKL